MVAWAAFGVECEWVSPDCWQDLTWRVMHVNWLVTGGWGLGGGRDGNNVLPKARIRLKAREPPRTAWDWGEDFNLPLLSPYEFNLWDNGWTVGIMWEAAHAAVTNAVKPFFGWQAALEAPRISSDTECCPTRSAALLATLSTSSRFGAGGGTQRRPPPEPRISQDLFPHSAACGFPRSSFTAQFCWSRSWRVYVPVRACFSVLWVIFLLPYCDSHIFSTCERTHAQRTKVYVSKSVLKYVFLFKEHTHFFCSRNSDISVVLVIVWICLELKQSVDYSH